MELRRLRYFIVTAEELHMARAAERLGIAQPALSQQIKVLETALGVRLFDRVSRGIKLSAVGEAFLPRARDTVAAADRAVDVALGTARGEIGKIEIGYVASAMVEPELPGLIGAFRHRYPNVEMRLRNLPADIQTEQLEDHRLDVAFIRSVIRPGSSLFRSRVFSSTRLVAAVPSDHRLVTLATPDLAYLSDDSFIVLQDTQTQGFFTETTIALCAQAGFTPRIDLQVSDITSMIGLVSAGLGVSLVPALISSLAMPNVTFRALSDLNVSVDLLVVERRMERSPVVRQFLDMMNT